MKSADVPLSNWFAKQKTAATVALNLAEQSSDISALRLSLRRVTHITEGKC
jgi:hypothetical protein